MDNRMSLLTSPFVPEGMVDLMKKLSKGVIKERPPNIYEYAAAFFEKMLIERDGSLDKGYGKFRSYAEYCKFMDKMDQRRLSQAKQKDEMISDMTGATDAVVETEAVQPSIIEVQGVAIQGVERKNKDSVKNVSINPKYKSQSEKVTKPVVSTAKNVKTKPRKLSSKKPSESLIVIKEETSADVDDSGNSESKLNTAAATIQKAFRMYRRKKNGQGENFTENTGKVSQLSEDAAAVIIQKAFKSLIQKLGSVAPKQEKSGAASITSVVVPVAGQENDIHIEPIVNNNDENSEQILLDNKHEDTRQLEKTSEVNDTTTAIEMNENKLATDLEVVTASDTSTQSTTANEPLSHESFSQVVLSSDNNKETIDDQGVVLPQASISSCIDEIVTPLDLNTNVIEMKEKVTDESSLVELKSNESTGDVGQEIESLGNPTGESRSDFIASNQVENASDDTVETDNTRSEPNSNTEIDQITNGTDQLESESTLKQLTNIENDKGLSNVGNGPEQTNFTTVVSEIETDKDQSKVAEKIVQPEIQDDPSQKEIQGDPSQQETKNDPSQQTESTSVEMKINPTLITLNENISQEHVSESEVDSNRDHLNDNVEEESSTNKQINDMTESVEPESKEQLFTVEKDGIYVNMDLLQEKFGTIAVDDGTGSDSEKSFKLNILEREDILVNQENVQQMRDDELTVDVDTLDKNNADENTDEGMERTENNIHNKDDEGNDEYELAETVVLMDIPLTNKSHGENELPKINGNDSSGTVNVFASDENPEQHVASETLKCETATVTQQNKSNNELVKLESSADDEKHLESKGTLDCVSVENQAKEEVTQTKKEILQKESVTEELQTNYDSAKGQLEKEVTHLLSNTEEAPQKVNVDVHIEDQLNKNETTHTKSNCDEVLNKETEIEVVKIVEDQLNKNEVVHETCNSEDISKKEKDVDVEETKHGNDDEQPNILKKEKDGEEERTKNESDDKQPNILKKDKDVDEEVTKHGNDDEQQNILKKEKDGEEERTKNESDDKQPNILKKEKDVDEEVTKHGNDDEQQNILKKEKDGEEERTKNESDDKQPNILKKEKDVDEEVTKHGNDDEQQNILKKEKDGEEERTKNESDDKQPNILKKEKDVDEEVTKHGNDDEQQNILKKEKDVDEEETKNENDDKQPSILKKEDDGDEETTENENDIQLKILKKEKDVVEEGTKHEQPNKDNDPTLHEDINSSRATEELATKTENQLGEKDDEYKIESESKQLEEVTSDEQIDLPKKGDEMVRTEHDEEPADQLLKSSANEQLVKAATIIQKVFRGYIVRNSQKSAKIPANNNNHNGQLELSAALIIQKYVRGYLVRRSQQKNNNLNIVRVTSNVNEPNVTQDDSNSNAAPPLPAYSNRFLIPKDSFLERESFADDEDYTRTCKELAATSIQKTYRGYRVRRSLKASNETDAEINHVQNGVDDGSNQVVTVVTEANNQVQTVVNEAERVMSAVLRDAIPVDAYDSDSFEDEPTENRNVLSDEGKSSKNEKCLNEPVEQDDSLLGQKVHDNVHVEGQMQQKYNQMAFRDSAINPIEEVSDSSDQPETPRTTQPQSDIKVLLESESMDSKYDGSKSFSYEQLSSDLSDTEENKRESLKESEVDETSRDERDDLSEVENFDLSSCGEDSLEAMYYSLRKNEIMVDRMQKQVADQREPKGDEFESIPSDNLKVEFPGRVTENLEVAMQQVFKSVESSSDCDGGKKDDDDNSLTLDLALDDSSSINDEREIETSRHIKWEESNLENNEQSESTIDIDAKDDENVSQSSESNLAKDVEIGNTEQSDQSDSSFNSSTRFIMKSQSVSEDMMNPIMFAMKRKQALLDQLHVRPYPIEENLSEDHDAFPEHLLSDIDIGNIQRKIFASSVSETDSDYIPNTTSRRLVRDDFNISTALDHLSTDSDSTIVSAATKIQAGARGFLTRRRLRRSSGTSISFEKRYSFGNAAIDKSLEDLIKRQEQINLDGAALKIQQQYRRYQARKKNLKKVSPIREQTLELSGDSSVEGMDDNVGIREITLAQKKAYICQQSLDETDHAHSISLNIDKVKRTPVNQRRLTLQRGDAVQRNSRPDSQDMNMKDATHTSADNQINEKLKDSETGEYTGPINNKQEKKVTAYINIQSLINRGIGPRQRSMPVQIDSELMRIIPKHLRKRVKSADTAKKRSN